AALEREGDRERAGNVVVGDRARELVTVAEADGAVGRTVTTDRRRVARQGTAVDDVLSDRQRVRRADGVARVCGDDRVADRHRDVAGHRAAAVVVDDDRGHGERADWPGDVVVGDRTDRLATRGEAHRAVRGA